MPRCEPRRRVCADAVVDRLLDQWMRKLVGEPPDDQTCSPYGLPLPPPASRRCGTSGIGAREARDLMYTAAVAWLRSWCVLLWAQLGTPGRHMRVRKGLGEHAAGNAGG